MARLWPSDPGGSHCNGSATSAFVYIGADADLSVLHHLRCSERKLLFVDPLTFWKNTARIQQAIRRGTTGADLDRLFECTDCASPLRDADVRSLSTMLVDALPLLQQQVLGCTLPDGQVSCYDAGICEQKVVGGPHIQVHSSDSWAVPHANTSVTAPILQIRFSQGRHARTLRYFAGRAEDVDWAAVLGGTPISTIASVGAAAVHSLPLLRHAYGTQPATMLRLLTTGMTREHVTSAFRSEKGTPPLRTVHDWAHLGCYCSRNRPSTPCMGSKTLQLATAPQRTR